MAGEPADPRAACRARRGGRAGAPGRIEIDRETVAALGQAEDRAKQAIRKRLALTPRKEVFLDVHGVATGFDDAVLDLASFWHFLGREGVRRAVAGGLPAAHVGHASGAASGGPPRNSSAGHWN